MDNQKMGRFIAGHGKAVGLTQLELICSISLTALFLGGIAVCAIVDVAINNGFSWSLYPISSIVFVWFVLFPIILFGKKGILPSMGVLTVLIVPYLFALDRIAGVEGLIFKAGAIIAAIFLIFLWSVWFIMKRYKNRKWIGAGISTILAAGVCVLINYSLSLTLTPEAAAFDVWDLLNIVILVVAGLAMISLDLILEKRKERR